MKIWWVLSWDQYYPGSCLSNVDSTWETKEEAEIRVEQIKRGDWCPDYVEVKNVSNLLGIEE